MDKALIWMAEAWQTPPMSNEGRKQAGFLIRMLQQGEKLSLPHSRPMAVIGKRVHELRISDEEAKRIWRIVYRIDRDAIVIVHWFAKKTRATPKPVIDTSKARLAQYDKATK